ncbi:MAG: hypothetical protein M0R73_02465 [Dehalococcoidia bacterium]|nr:hypothetical protein [Dehalococcoidia bacterium]
MTHDTTPDATPEATPHEAAPHEATPREIDLRGIEMATLVEHARVAIEAARSGESVRVLADNEVVVKYLTPTAATSGVRCRFGPAQDGIWSIDLSPRT